MAKTHRHPTEANFSLNLDRALKDAFTAAARAEDRPAEQVVRDFMQAYVARQRRNVELSEARRQSLLIAERARDPGSDEAQVMREIEAENCFLSTSCRLPLSSA